MRHPYRPIHKRSVPVREPATSRTPYPRSEGREKLDERLIDNAIAPLMEHFDTVQVVATRYANDGTVLMARGAGNFYARMGSVREWFARDDEQTRCHVRNKLDDDSPSFS